MKTNHVGTTGRCPPPPTTREGAPAVIFGPLGELKRAVLTCLLWESGFYENGVAIADRIKLLVPQCNPHDVAELAIAARERQHLRHVPLLLVRELARFPARCADHLIADTLTRVIQRADEITEFMALYWKDGRTPIAKQVKVGLARAFKKFDEYQLAKYDRKDAPIRLRDVMFLVHPKPADARHPDSPIGGGVSFGLPVRRKNYQRGAVARHHGELLDKLTKQTLETPDTWETQLSAGADKKATFERLLAENKLGYMALLRNLRNMRDAEVDRDIVIKHLIERAARSKALPFRFVAAHRAVPNWLDAALNAAMCESMKALDKLPGKTVVLVDVSGSMDVKLSAKSDLTRLDAAASLATLVAGLASDSGVAILTFSNVVMQIDPRDGCEGPLHLVQMIHESQPHAGTYLGKAVQLTRKSFPDMERLIVITDEQASDVVPDPGCRGYLINVAQEQRGVGYGGWIRINGFSEAVVQYIHALEAC